MSQKLLTLGYTLRTSERGQPLYKGQNSWSYIVPNVSSIQRFHCMKFLPLLTLNLWVSPYMSIFRAVWTPPWTRATSYCWERSRSHYWTGWKFQELTQTLTPCPVNSWGSTLVMLESMSTLTSAMRLQQNYRYITFSTSNLLHITTLITYRRLGNVQHFCHWHNIQELDTTSTHVRVQCTYNVKWIG